MGKIGAFVTLCVVGFFAYLFFSAKKGDTVSIAILAAGAAIILILVGVGIAIVVMYATGRRDRLNDRDTRQVVGTLTDITRAQDIQNRMLSRQIGPAPSGPALPLPSQEGAWLPALREWEVIDNEEQPIEPHQG